MRRAGKIVLWCVSALSAVVVGGGVWLAVSPPELLRVGSGYAAKIVCSNVFVAGRDAAEVLAVDVQAPGHPLLRLMRVSVDRPSRTVTAAIAGFFAANMAVYRDGLGCAVVPDGNVDEARRITLDVAPAQENVDVLWPVGAAVDTAAAPALSTLLADERLTGPGMRAVLVVRNGRIAGEIYGKGFSRDTPLLGWSMAKTVNAAIIGRRVKDGRMALADTSLVPQWRNDPRASISLAQLLAMESGLEFNENYGMVADVTRMLFLEPDMAGFATGKSLETTPGTSFHYSSGTSVILSRLWMDTFEKPQDALAYPRSALFGPLGMTSAVLEADALGTFVGSSYLYATGLDWARFALFLLRDGVWNGDRLLPEGFVTMMQTPTRASGGRFTQIQSWASKAGEVPDMLTGIFWLRGHDGQIIAIVPSQDLAVIRLGLTPWDGYSAQPLVEAVADALSAFPAKK